MQMAVCVLAPMHVILRGEYVVHAPNDEGYVAILLQRDEHAAVVTMLQQLDSFDFHVLGLAVDSWNAPHVIECHIGVERLRRHLE